jgi:hypothetical protein
MKYFFGTNNNYLSIDKYIRLNKQIQLLTSKGYIFCNGRLVVPEEKQFIVAGSNKVVEGVPLTVPKTGWYTPSDLVGETFFVHKGQLKLKKPVDFTKYLVLIAYDTDDKLDYPVYSMNPVAYQELAKTMFDDGIGSIRIGTVLYLKHNFLLSNFPTMRALEDFYRLYIFDAS